MNNFFDKHIGHKYSETDGQGNYLACMLPFYLLCPNAYKFKHFGLTNKSVRKILSNHCIEINDNFKFGDLFIVKQFRRFHVFVYVDNTKFVHIQLNQKLSYIDKHLVNRLKRFGVYRWLKQ